MRVSCHIALNDQHFNYAVFNIPETAVTWLWERRLSESFHADGSHVAWAVEWYL